MDFVIRKQVDGIVAKAIAGPPGTPDWTAILSFISIIEEQKDTFYLFVDSIVSYLTRGGFATKLNTLIVVDALFKNLKKPFLQDLQSPKLMSVLTISEITSMPSLQNFVHKSSVQWVESCRQKGCLKKEFESWQATNCNFQLVPMISNELKERLLSDINSANEILQIFVECIITAVKENSGVTKLMLEMFPNVSEIRVRTGEMLPNIADKELKAAFQSTGNLAAKCILSYQQLQRGETIDTLGLGKAISAVEHEKAKHIDSAEVKKRDPVKRVPGDITDEEFFRRFDQLKQGNLISENKPVDLLGALTVPSEQSKQTDSLIDF